MADDGKEHLGDLRRVLMVLSSHDKLGDTGKSTGWFVLECAQHGFVLPLTILLLVRAVALGCVCGSGGVEDEGVRGPALDRHKKMTVAVQGEVSDGDGARHGLDGGQVPHAHASADRLDWWEICDLHL